MFSVDAQAAADDILIQGYARIRVDTQHWSDIGRMLDRAFTFFGRPLDEKLCAALPGDCGFRPLGVEYSQDGGGPDQIESYTVSGRPTEQSSTDPANELREAGALVFEHLARLAERITERLAATCTGDDRSWRYAGRCQRWSRLQMNFSRPAHAPTELLHETHEDGVLLTIGGATAPGLERQKPDGSFEPLATRTGELLVTPGVIAYLLSGGAVRPFHHRVVAHRPTSRRLAYLMFADLDPAVCSAWVTNQTNADIDIGAHVRRTMRRFGMDGFSSD